MPDATSLERTKEVVNRVDKICHAEKGVAHTISISGQSFVLGANGPNFGQLFMPLKPFDERTIARHVQHRHRRPADQADRQGSPGGARWPSSGRRRFPASAPAAASSSSSRTAARTTWPTAAKADRQPRRPGQQGPQAQGADDHFHGQIAAEVRGHQPRPVREAGRQPRRRVQHLADLPRLALRQRLQPGRPHLAGQRPGGGPLPQSGHGRAAADGPQQDGRHGAAGHGGRRDRHQRPADPDALQHVPRGGHHRRHAEGRQLRRRHQDHGGPGRPGTCPSRWPTSGPRSPTSSSSRATPP